MPLSYICSCTILNSFVWLQGHCAHWSLSVLMPIGEFMKQMFIDSGVDKSKLQIVPEGVDTKFYDPDRTSPMRLPGVKSFVGASPRYWLPRFLIVHLLLSLLIV